MYNLNIVITINALKFNALQNQQHRFSIFWNFNLNYSAIVLLSGGYKLPANSHLNIFIYAMHRDPKVFPDPECFIPERFDSRHQIHPFSYIPFSAGPRNCIGWYLYDMIMLMVHCIWKITHRVKDVVHLCYEVNIDI